MPHEIETFDDGTAAFFTARTDAWHQLGTVTRDCLTAEDVMTTAQLGGWNVRTIPLTGNRDHRRRGHHRPDHRPLRHHPHPPPHRETRRARRGRRQLHRRAERTTLRELLNLLVDEAGAHFETAGSLREGRETFVTMKLPNTLTTGTDGQATTSTCTWPPCPPTTAPPPGGSSSPRCASSAPTPNASPSPRPGLVFDPVHPVGRREDRRSPPRPGIVFRYCEHFEAAAQSLINQTLELDEFQQIIDKVWPTPATPPSAPGPPASGTAATPAAGPVHHRRHSDRDSRHPLGRAAGHHRIPRPPSSQKTTTSARIGC